MARGDITLVTHNVAKKGNQWRVHANGSVAKSGLDTRREAIAEARSMANSGDVIAVHEASGRIERKIEV